MILDEKNTQGLRETITRQKEITLPDFSPLISKIQT